MGVWTEVIVAIVGSNVVCVALQALCSIQLYGRKKKWSKEVARTRVLVFYTSTRVLADNSLTYSGTYSGDGVFTLATSTRKCTPLLYSQDMTDAIYLVAILRIAKKSSGHSRLRFRPIGIFQVCLPISHCVVAGVAGI